jgi:nicotinate-nucleotide pyrophosphorylase (carboxylating)
LSLEHGTEVKLPDILSNDQVADLVRRALEEDVGTGDVTSSLIPESASARAVIVSRGQYVISGIDIARAVFRETDPHLKIECLVPDGQHAGAGTDIMTIQGSARNILTSERTALNFLQRMTGIATLTSRFVKEVAGTNVTILDTRKTTPSLRILEKYAVLCGGGENHRMGLYDRVLIKDNHRKLLGNEKQQCPLDQAVTRSRKAFPAIPVEVEVESLDQLKKALEGNPDWILVDNTHPAELKQYVEICRGKAGVEASGGITLENVRQVADTGVHAISLGCLTHSAPAADFSLEIR